MREKYHAVREGIKNQNDSYYSPLFSETSAESSPGNGGKKTLDLEKVTQLFKMALDHLAKSTSYATLTPPCVDPQVIKDFDENGGEFVLVISQTHKKPIHGHQRATRLHASGERKQQLSERYFSNAC